MRASRRIACWIAALAALTVLGHSADAPASTRKGRDPAAGVAARAPATRADKPVVTATAPAAGQAGYVHFFLIKLPDEALDIQVGIELPDQRIAWSFPGVGATVSPLIESGTVTAGGDDYYVWHLYAIRPFPDEASMAALRKQIERRIRPWIKAKTPYCENEGLKSRCMSCLGFVLRALFPARSNGYPALPREFARAGTASKYTTRDLLLYLTGMLELPTLQARLQRIARLQLPTDLREDLEEIVYSTASVEEQTAARPATRPAQRKKL